MSSPSTSIDDGEVVTIEQLPVPDEASWNDRYVTVVGGAVVDLTTWELHTLPCEDLDEPLRLLPDGSRSEAAPMQQHPGPERRERRAPAPSPRRAAPDQRRASSSSQRA